MLEKIMNAPVTMNRLVDAVDKTNVPVNTPIKPKGKIHLMYFTDPFSTACFAMEEAFGKLMSNYKNELDLNIHMGGLMPLWQLYRNNGISTYADMARHWKNAGENYGLRISGEVWLQDPPHSSFPPSIAFKAAQIQSLEKAASFLRIMREMLLIHNYNISKREWIEVAALNTGLDLAQLNRDHKEGQKLFENDLELVDKFDIQAFPTMIITDINKKKKILVGVYNYEKLSSSLQAFAQSEAKEHY